VATYKEYEHISQEYKPYQFFKNRNSLVNKLYNFFINPFGHFLSIDKFIWVIIFILIYRLADNMLVIMINPFLIKIGYTAKEIAGISKFFGTIMVIAGTFICGHIMIKLNIRISLITFSLFHLLGHCLFIFLNFSGKNIPLLYFITAYEALTGGMVMTAYISFISSLCKGKYVATQYALLSSGIGLSRTLFPTASGIIVDSFGWNFFFSSIVLISIASVIFIYYMPKQLYAEHQST
jgi:PAT family beta-lactamase induction signal transducer AmpG